MLLLISSPLEARVVHHLLQTLQRIVICSMCCRSRFSSGSASRQAESDPARHRRNDRSALAAPPVLFDQAFEDGRKQLNPAALTCGSSGQNPASPCTRPVAHARARHAKTRATLGHDAEQAILARIEIGDSRDRADRGRDCRCADFLPEDQAHTEAGHNASSRAPDPDSWLENAQLSAPRETARKSGNNGISVRGHAVSVVPASAQRRRAQKPARRRLETTVGHEDDVVAGLCLCAQQRDQRVDRRRRVPRPPSAAVTCWRPRAIPAAAGRPRRRRRQRRRQFVGCAPMRIELERGSTPPGCARCQPSRAGRPAWSRWRWDDGRSRRRHATPSTSPTQFHPALDAAKIGQRRDRLRHRRPPASAAASAASAFITL